MQVPVPNNQQRPAWWRIERKGWRGLAAAVLPYAILTLFAAAIVGGTAIRATWPLTHERVRYVVLVEYFARAFVEGQWWPRWLPELNGGYGYPLFVFYQPLFFFLALPFRLLTKDPLLSTWLAIGAAFVVGAAGSYKLCARTGNKIFGLFGGALFLLTPYIYVNLLVRGDLSELLAMCLAPWTLFFLSAGIDAWHAGRSSARAITGLALTTAAVLMAHPITGLLLAPSLMLIGLAGAVGLRGIAWGLLLRLGLAGFAAVALATPYWHPLVSMRKAVNFDAAFGDYYQSIRHTVHWHQLLGGPWGMGISVLDSPNDQISFELGRLQLATALCGAVVGWSNRFIRGAALAFVISVAAMTPTLGSLWTIRPFSEMQFPWRLLSVTAGLEVALASGWLVGLAKIHSFDKPRLAIVLGLAVLAAGFRPEQFQLQELTEARATVRRTLDEMSHTPSKFAEKDEFRPRTAKVPLPPRGDQPLVATRPNVDARPRPRHGPYEIAVDVDVSQPVEVTVNQLYFPGWDVKVQGRSIPTEELERGLGDDGRIRVKLVPAAGSPQQLIVARYQGPPGEPVRWLGVVIGTAVLVAPGLLHWRRRKRRAPAHSRQVADAAVGGPAPLR